MGSIGVVIVVVAIMATMGAALYSYTLYQTNFIQVVSGEPVTVGPVKYTIMFEGTHEGSKQVQPENVFVQIGITAMNVSQEDVMLSGGQLYIVDEAEQKHQPVYGEFSAKDLFVESIEPGQSIERSTQFDIPFDKDAQYNIIIRPQKEQSTVDTAIVCITNCQVSK